MELTNIILSEKQWNKDLIFQVKEQHQNLSWLLIDDKKDFSSANLDNLNVDKIFIPHWSYIIPEEIFMKYECIVFHMTDLPFGRGGSPLQNLIARGHKETKISALRVVKEVDAGPIYLKRDLDLSGTAQEIFSRANGIIEEMINSIISKDLKPKAQEGEIVHFKRRKPADSNLEELSNLEKVYDYIRMLDADGYPQAFLETSNLRLEFTEAKFSRNEEIITAHVRIVKK